MDQPIQAAPLPYMPEVLQFESRLGKMKVRLNGELKERAQVEERKKALVNEVKKLRSTLNVVQTELSQSSEKHELAVTSLRNQSLEERRRRETLEEYHRNDTTTISNLQRQVTALGDANVKLLSRDAELATQVADLEQQLEQLENENKKISEDTKILMLRCDDETRTKKKLESDLEQKETTIKNQAERMTALEHINAALEQELIDAKTIVQTLTKERDILQTDLETTKKKLSIAQSDVKSLTRLLASDNNKNIRRKGKTGVNDILQRARELDTTSPIGRPRRESEILRNSAALQHNGVNNSDTAQNEDGSKKSESFPSVPNNNSSVRNQTPSNNNRGSTPSNIAGVTNNTNNNHNGNNNHHVVKNSPISIGVNYQLEDGQEMAKALVKVLESPLMTIIRAVTDFFVRLKTRTIVNNTLNTSSSPSSSSASSSPRQSISQEEIRVTLFQAMQTVSHCNFYRPAFEVLFQQLVNVLDHKTRLWLLGEFTGYNVSPPLSSIPMSSMLKKKRRERGISDVNLENIKGDCVHQWDFDANQYSSQELQALYFYMLDRLGLIKKFKIPTSNLILFLRRVSDMYHMNPFHNFRHAVDIAQVVFFWVYNTKSKEYLTDLDVLGLMVGAICHDLDHNGLNNSFHINTKSSLAQIYNDNSVLENHHSALSFYILSRAGSNLFVNLTTAEFKDVRRIMIEGILATDMSLHFELATKFFNQLESPQAFNNPSKAVRQLLVNVILHTADISNVSRPYNISRRWSDLVQEEFLTQGDLEKQKGMTISPFMDRTSVDQVKMTLNFIDFMVAPVLKSLAKVIPEVSQCVDCMVINRAKWLVNGMNIGKNSNLMGSPISSTSTGGMFPSLSKFSNVLGKNQDETEEEEQDEDPLFDPILVPNGEQSGNNNNNNNHFQKVLRTKSQQTLYDNTTVESNTSTPLSSYTIPASNPHQLTSESPQTQTHNTPHRPPSSSSSKIV